MKYLFAITVGGLVLDFTKLKNMIFNHMFIALAPVFLCEEIALNFNREIEFKKFKEYNDLLVRLQLTKMQKNHQQCFHILKSNNQSKLIQNLKFWIRNYEIFNQIRDLNLRGTNSLTLKTMKCQTGKEFLDFGGWINLKELNIYTPFKINFAHEIELFVLRIKAPTGCKYRFGNK